MTRLFGGRVLLLLATACGLAVSGALVGREATARQGEGTPAVVVAGTPAAMATPVTAGERLPLGGVELPETRTTLAVAPGVTFTRIVRGARSEEDVFGVDVAFVGAEEEARRIAEELAGRGIEARVEEVADRAPDDAATGPLGYRVRVGRFATNEEAVAARTDLLELGYESSRVVYTGEDGGETTGPWVVHVLDVEPGAFGGTVEPVLATELVPGKERVAEIAARTGALAAINGGYFVVGPTDGTPGDFAGVSVIGGRLLSEAVNGRTALVFPGEDGERIDVAAVTTELGVAAADGAMREVDGLNREPGLVRGCGGGGGDQPTEAPKHDFTCTDESELVLFSSEFGQVTVAGEGVEVALDASGTVVEVRERRGGEIPRGGTALSGTGDAGEWLSEHATVGSRVEVEPRLLADGEALDLAETEGIVNGGPRLVADGEVAISAAAEGFHWEEDPGFYYRFGARRNPRTMAGVTADGGLLLVTVDGRQPGWSVGASFEESAAIMRALGAEEAVNLDGGGSTAMAIGPDLVNRPSDPTGERPDADAIVLRP